MLVEGMFWHAVEKAVAALWECMALFWGEREGFRKG